MPRLRIEHKVDDFNAWERALDNDPLDRKKSGVTRLEIWRSLEPAGHVMIDLEFEGVDAARRMLENLRDLWTEAHGAGLIGDQQTWIIEADEGDEGDEGDEAGSY